MYGKIYLENRITEVQNTWLWIFPHAAMKCLGPAIYPSRQPVIAKAYKILNVSLQIQINHFRIFLHYIWNLTWKRHWTQEEYEMDILLSI